MKGFYHIGRIAFILFMLPLATNAQIWTEDFDGSNTTNPPTFSLQCSDDRDYIDIVCQDNAGCANEINDDFVINGATGQYLGVRDMDHSPCTSSLNETVGFAGIDVSSCAGVMHVCFDVAESRNMGGVGGTEWTSSGGGREDTWDGDSNVRLKASIDGMPFTTVTSIEAMENSDTRPGIDVNCDGKANDAGEPELTDTFTKYCFELPTNGSTLDLEFEINFLNTGGEDVAIDNIEVVCGMPTSGTVLQSCTPFVSMAAIFREDFDGSNPNNPFSFPCGIRDSRDYYGRVCLDDGPCGSADINSDYTYGGAVGSFFGARDISGTRSDEPCGTATTATATATGIDISSCVNANLIYLCFDAAESDSQPREGSDTWDGNQNPPADDSFLTFSASVNGGSDDTILSFAAVGNNNSGPALDTDCDGVGDGAALSSTFTTFCALIPATGSTLDLSFTVGGLNTDGDDVAIDNIAIYCTDDVAELPAALSIACTLPPDAVVPTMGEWALFILFLLIINMGAVFMIATQNSLKLATENQQISMANIFNAAPFNKTNFMRALTHAFGIALIGFAVIYMFWGEIVAADFIGMAFSIPLVAYFIHLFFDKK